ncbi:MAG TPA: carbohydrate ABC transporter permease [Clostridia bacterium]|nr:carbohydrate ABC transporter permease [Clostridia bacterium]
MKNTLNRTQINDVIFNGFNGIFMLLLIVVMLYPFLNTVAISFNDGLDSVKGGIYLWPRIFSLQSYKAVFFGGAVYHAFFISVARTVIATVLNIFITTMLSYALSRREYILRKFITVIVVLTMYFNAGLIPYYLLYKSLGLRNSFLVYIIPTMISAFNMVVIRTYIRTLPESMVESARIDGAGEFRIFLRIIFPLCKPILATVALFVAVWQWNQWFDTFIYNSGVQNLSTMQYELMKLLTSTTSANSNPSLVGGVGATGATNLVTPISIRSAITVVAAVPMIIVYPFLQNYFVVGLAVGSIKE